MGVPLLFPLQKADDIERQAKEWASILSNKIAREKAEKAARIMLEHDIELPQLKENGRMKKGVIAQFISDKLAIEVNKKANDDVWKKDAQSVDIGWSSQNNPILHELGHYIDFICNEEKYNKRSENSRFFGEKKLLIEKELSKYAATNQWEFEAELISATLKGKTFSKELLSYSRLNNPEKNKELAKQLLNYGSGKEICTPVDIVREKFDAMMETVSKEKSKELDVSFLRKQTVQDFINTHTDVLNATLRNIGMPDVMRERMKESNYVFSGIKTFHELKEAFPSLIDSNGNKKPFEQFLNDVRKIDNTYNANYLKTEYEFAQSSAMMAARWKEFEKDGDNYYLQYRTVGDKRVRRTHRMLHNITLPFSSKFWDKYFPPNGWNCRCTVVQVRKDKYKMSDETAAMNAGSQATAGKHQEMFMFNPGKEMTTFPAYNAYTIRSCKTCPYRLGKMELIKDETSSNELCQVCKFMRGIHKDPNDNNYDIIPTSKGKVRIHIGHGKAEREENLAIAKYLANKYGYEIDLLDNPQNIRTADSYNKTLGIEQEYKRAQTPTKNAIDRLIRDGKRQANNLVLLLDFKMNLSWDEITKVLRPRVVRSENIESITFIYEGKDVTLSREEILKEGFKIRLADLK